MTKHGGTLIGLAVVAVVIGAALIGYSSQSTEMEKPEAAAVAAAEAATPATPAANATEASATASNNAAEPVKDVTKFDPTALEPSVFDIVIGQPNAPVTLVEYASLSCPHCAHFYHEEIPTLEKDYVEKGMLKILFRHFPLNAPALKGAVAVECAPEAQRRALLGHLFETQNEWAYSENYLQAAAKEAAGFGVTQEMFDKCSGDVDLENRILQTRQVAEDKLQVASTPSLFVNGQRFDGAPSLDVLRKAIDAALASTSKATP